MKNKDIFLSIIIPVYNAEKYIKRCLDSIFNQLIPNCEVVIVDDGSTDNSGAICDNYQMNYPNLCYVFHQNNKGASTSRNCGLLNSNGKYIWFVDADDFIELGCLDTLIKEIKKYSCDVFSFDYINSGHRKHDFFEKQIVSGVSLVQKNSRLYLWNHIYKRTAIGDIRFLDGTKNIEDWLFNLMVFVKLKSIMHLPIVGYHYCDDNQTSTSRNRSKDNLNKLSQDTLTIQHALLKCCNETNDEEQRFVLMDALNFSVIGHLYSLFRYYDPQDFIKVVNLYKKIGLFPVKKTNNRKANLFRIFANKPYLVNYTMRFCRLLK